MVKAFQLVRNGKPMDSLVYKSKQQAEKEKVEVNKQFKEFNKYILKNKLNKKPIKLVSVKEISFSRKKNVF